MKLKAGLVGLTAIALVCMALSGPVWAQMGPGGTTPPKPDPVAMLNNTLESAGAAQLGPDQQTRLASVVNDYSTAHQPPQKGAGNPDIQAAKKDLEAAILSKNAAAADAAADKLSTQFTGRATSTIRDLARFEIQVLDILTPDQVNALRTQYGNEGLLRTLGSLAGGWWFHGGFGHGMMQRGRMR
jgi:hypothetical protein